MNHPPHETHTPDDDPRGYALAEGFEVGGRYRLERRLGQGAMGEVWSAIHTMMKKRVAIKFLHAKVATRQDFVDRFQREAQAAANIDHPNICAATDFGKTGDQSFFLVMEFIEGETLSDLLSDRGTLSIEQATRITTQICDALAQAHEMGIVHRDLKPDNIMLIRRGDDPHFVKILDFGIAHVEFDGENEEDFKKLTQAGEVFGTPHYMSPEQIRSKPIGAASDLYSVGIIYTEMITGQVPFDADTLFGILEEHLNRPPPRLKELGDADYPNAIQAIVDRLLAKEGTQRYGDAMALREALWRAVPAVAPGSSMELRASPKEEDQTAFVESQAPQRTWPDFDHKTLAGFGGLAAGALLLTLAIGLPPSTDGSSNSSPLFGTSLADQRADFEKRDAVRPAMDALVRGQVSEALDHLEKLVHQEPENPHLHYLIGVSNDRIKSTNNAAKAFIKTTKIEPEYGREEAVQAGIFGCMKTKACNEYKLLQQLIEDDDHSALRQKLRRSARTGESKRVRARSMEVLEGADLLRTLDAWEQNSIELINASGCKARKEAIAKLVEIGDTRGIAALEFYSEKPSKGCGLLKLNDCYACLRKPLRKAIAKLQKS
jgi:eukaryotic-like serine/threonine-protein kinase